MKTLSIDLIARAGQHGSRTAILDANGAITYHELLLGARRAAAHLLDGRSDLGEARVACLVAPGRHHVIAQWGSWLAGGVAVPLCLTHPRPEMEYMIADSGASVLVADREFETLARSLAAGKDLRLVLTDELGAGAHAPEIAVSPERRALIIYTSGTTGKPKGVVLTHRNIQAQVACLVGAWGWSGDDHILHVLPLHHVHGIVNVLACALWSGAVCEMLPRFDAAQVWRSFLRRNLTLFMAVPVIYHRLTAAWEESDAAMRRSMTEACRSMRLMVCGSAALPVPVLEKWREVSGHTLLERYGMTEIGMALSNPLRGDRVPGMVGSPLRGVDVRLVDETGRLLGDGQPGEIEVRGPGVFGEYWGRPEETVAAFHEGWFRTGDVAIRTQGIYRILGRQSVDIIKTGAYKVSALEIEQELLSHPRIEECAVVGVPDEEWGERVCAAIKWRRAEAISLDELRAWGKERLAVYKIPSRILSVEVLPRNAMGKITKKDVQAMFAAPTKSSRSCPIGKNILPMTADAFGTKPRGRVLIGKPGLDGHTRGAKFVAKALADHGFEVIYTGIRRTPREIAATAVQENVDAIGLSLLSGAHNTLCPAVIEELRKAGAGDIPVVVGGIIPELDIPGLLAGGIGAVFTSGTPRATIIAAFERMCAKGKSAQ